MLQTPPPDVLLIGFDASSMNYRARFWVDDYEHDQVVKDQVRVAIHYAFARRGIEIPYPVQVEYSRDWPSPDPAAEQGNRERVLSNVDLFSTLSEAQRADLAVGDDGAHLRGR